MIDVFDIEEDFFGDEKKSIKETRKRKEASDRSKYKKSDQKSRGDETEEVRGDLEGIVVEISSRGYLVKKDENLFLCTLRGSFKEERSQNKTLVAIGDKVGFDISNPEEGLIGTVFPRRSELVRQDNLTRRKKQIIAANVDLLLITVSIGSPPLRASIIDRYLIAARAGNMKAALVINKIDLLETFEDQKELLEEVKKAYEQAKIPIFLVSSETGEGLPALEEFLKDKISVFSGPSGVGKSSLLIHLTGLDFVVGEVVERTGKGSHTTTSPRLIPLKKGGLTIDTPGIKSFGLFKIGKDDILEAFPEWAPIARKCRFSDCTHRNEDGCAVKRAVEKEKISFLRYNSYLDLLEELEEIYKRR